MSTTYDLFMSHNGLDKPLVERLCWALLDAGLRPWFDKWDLAPGDVWIREIERVLETVPAVLVCVGAHGLSAWHDAERQAAIHRVTSKGSGVVVPVLLPGAPEQVDLPVFLRGLQSVDLRAEQAWEAGIVRLAGTLLGKKPSPPAFIDEGRARPYRGLQPFTEADAGWMFGREREESKLLDALREGQRFITVVGASGSGKSSLVRAGVVPAVRTGGVDGRQRWHAMVLRPGPRPCHALALKLMELRRNVAGTGIDIVRDGDDLESLRERLVKSEHALSDTADLLLAWEEGEGQLLLVADQFEELFTESGAQNARWDDSQDLAGGGFTTSTKLAPEGAAFLRNLLFATSVEGGRVRVILTVRADFTGDCLAVPELARRMERMNFALPPMEAGQLREAIRRPALRVGYDVEKALIDVLVSATEDQAGRLPLLQHTLDVLWDVRDRSTRRLTHAAYNEHVGSLEESVAKRAEEVFAELLATSTGSEPAMRRVFLRLVHLGEGTGDTRRQVPRSELSGDIAAGIVFDAFIHARLLVTDTYRGGTGNEIEQAMEIAHEALLGRWGRLRRWLNEDREALRMRQAVNFAAREWQKRGRPADELWSGGRLARAHEMLAESAIDLSEDERTFLTASKTVEQGAKVMENRRQRWFLFAALGASGYLLLTLVVVVFQYMEALALADYNVELASQKDAEARRAEDLASQARRAAVNLYIEAGRRELFSEHNSQEALLLLNEAYRLEPEGDVLPFMLAQAARSTDALLHSLPTHEKGVKFMTFDPPGDRLLTLDWEGAVRIWDVKTGAWEAEFTVEDEAIFNAAFVAHAPDRVVVYTRNNVLAQFNATTGATLSRGAPQWPEVSRRSEDGSVGLVGSIDQDRALFQDTRDGGGLWIVDVGSGALIRQFRLSEGPRLAWNHTNMEGATVLAKYATPGAYFNLNFHSMVSWNLATGEPIATFAQPAGEDSDKFPQALSVHEGQAFFFSLATERGSLGQSSPAPVAWDTRRGTIRPFKPCPSIPEFSRASLDVSPDRAHLFGLHDGRLIRWSIESGDCEAVSKEFDREYKDFQVHSREIGLVLQGEGAEIALVDYEDLSIQRRFVAHSTPLQHMILQTGGTLLATAAMNGEVRLWELDDQTSVFKSSFRRGHEGRDVARYEDARRALRAPCSLRTMTPAKPVAVSDIPLNRSHVEADGLRLEVESSQGEDTAYVRVNDGCDVWDSKSGQRYGALFSSRRNLSVTLRGGFIGNSYVLSSWREPSAKFRALSSDVLLKLPELGFSDFFPELMVQEASLDLSRGWGYGLADLSHGSERLHLEPGDPRDFKYNITEEVGSPDGRLIVQESTAGSVVVYDAETGAHLRTLREDDSHPGSWGSSNDCRMPSFSPTWEHLVTSRPDGTVDVWDTESLAHIASLKGHKKHACGSAFDPFGTRLITFDLMSSGEAFLWRLDEEGPGMRLEGDIRLATFSSDGRFIASGDREGLIRVWHVESGGQIAEFRGHRSRITRLAFSGDSARLYSVDSKDEVMVWQLRPETRTAEEIDAVIADRVPFVFQNGRVSLR